MKNYAKKWRRFRVHYRVAKIMNGYMLALKTGTKKWESCFLLKNKCCQIARKNESKSVTFEKRFTVIQFNNGEMFGLKAFNFISNSKRFGKYEKAFTL